MNKTFKLILAVIFFVISYIETKDAMTSKCITVRMVSICDWTIYVWALCPALLGIYLIWSAFIIVPKDK